MKTLVEKLTQAFGPSGYENEIRDIILNEARPYADTCTIDRMGNLIVRKGERVGKGKRIMISAHMDEIGLMVSHVNEEGFAYFTFLGGVNPLTCYGNRARFMNGAEGVIYAENERKATLPALPELYIDTGAKSKNDCPIKPGDTGVFTRPFVDMNGRWVSKAMDDRIGCAIAIETLKKISNTPNEIVFVFSVQEEVGARGATVAAYAIDPDIGIAIDVTLSMDTPRGTQGNMVLGNGPCIKVRDSSLIANPKVVSAMVSAANKASIPYQMEVLRTAGTDAGAIQLVRGGVPSGCLSVACRYVHSPSEMVDAKDVENAVLLLSTLLNNEIEL